jgi:general secretion pathway protein D
LRLFARHSFVRILLVLAELCLVTGAWATEASDLYRDGRKAEKAGHIAQAYLLYSEAAALDPGNHLYWLRSEALKTGAMMEGKVVPHLASAAMLPEITTEEADTTLEPVTPEDLAEARKPLPPTELKAQEGRKDFDVKGDAKVLFQAAAHAFGLDCVFDGDYTAGKPIHFRIDQADYRETLHALEAATGSFLVPISQRLFLVVKDTTQKRHEEEPYVAVMIPVPEATSAQDLTAMVTAVQQSCGIQKVGWDSQRNVVVMRDAISKVLPARRLFEDLLYPRAQILIEMQMLEVNRNEMVEYGLTLPTSFPVAFFSTLLQNVPSISSSLSGMLLIGGGQTMIGLGLVNSMVVATLSRSISNNLLDATLRSIDNQPATLHIGQKYPVLTSSYVGTSGVAGSNVVQPAPSFTFEDLGLSLKVTPHVHGADEVTLSLEAEFKLLAGSALNGIPVISNRSLKSDVTLRMGEWAVVAGLMEDQDARTIAGIPGIANIPVLGPLMETTTRNKESDQVVILLKPTLVTPPPDQVLTHVFRMGSETRPLTPL